MWRANGLNISMAEGDFGIELPLTLKGATVTENDSFSFTVKTAINGTQILKKTFAPNGNVVPIILSQQESSLLPVGSYVYGIDWYNNNVFMCNVVLGAILEVNDKA